MKLLSTFPTGAFLALFVSAAAHADFTSEAATPDQLSLTSPPGETLTAPSDEGPSPEVSYQSDVPRADPYSEDDSELDSSPTLVHSLRQAARMQRQAQLDAQAAGEDLDRTDWNFQGDRAPAIDGPPTEEPQGEQAALYR